jgi:hypothetical protein
VCTNLYIQWVETDQSNFRIYPMDICFPLASWYNVNGLCGCLYGCWWMLDRLISTHPSEIIRHSNKYRCFIQETSCSVQAQLDGSELEKIFIYICAWTLSTIAFTLSWISVIQTSSHSLPSNWASTEHEVSWIKNTYLLECLIISLSYTYSSSVACLAFTIQGKSLLGWISLFWMSLCWVSWRQTVPFEHCKKV